MCSVCSHSFTLLMWPFLISIVQGYASASPPRFWHFHTGYLSKDSWSSYEGDWSLNDLCCYLDSIISNWCSCNLFKYILWPSTAKTQFSFYLFFCLCVFSFYGLTFLTGRSKSWRWKWAGRKIWSVFHWF